MSDYEAKVGELREIYRQCDDYIAELEAKCRDLEEDNAKLEARCKDLTEGFFYRDGMIAGLKYAIRCNGVSGGEVDQ